MKWSHSLTLAIGLGTCLLTPSAALAAQPAENPLSAAELPYKYQAGFYQVTAAEREAICLQTYYCAMRVITNKLFDGSFIEKNGLLYEEVWITGANGEMNRSLRPAAIVLDIDETVIDNGEYACWCVAYPEHNGGNFSDFIRYQSELEHPATVPGAVVFIKTCQALGITPLFITDRDVKYRDYTLATLRHAGIDSPTLDGDVYFSDAKDSQKAAQVVMKRLGMQADDAIYTDCLNNASNKALRRFVLETDYKVLGYFGDDLYDHPVMVERSAQGENAIAQRHEQVRLNRRHFGRDWFVLPNPSYGYWLVPQDGHFLRGQDMKDMLANRCKFYNHWWQTHRTPLNLITDPKAPKTSEPKPISVPNTVKN